MKSNRVLLLYAIFNSHNKNDSNMYNYNDYNNKYKMNTDVASIREFKDIVKYGLCIGCANNKRGPLEINIVKN